MKKIIFKIAFSRKVGSGHLYRSSNLAQLLKDRGVETILILEKKNEVPKNLKTFSYIKIYLVYIVVII